LHKEVKAAFPGAHSIGCLFHFKQAIRRKLVKLGIDASQVLIAMQPGHLDLVTIVDPAKMERMIDYIRYHLDTGNCYVLWNLFWLYFKKTWMTIYSVSDWNIFALAKEDVEIRNCTNNALEGFNKVAADRLGIHPAISKYVEGTKELSVEYVQKLDNIRLGRERAPNNQTVQYPNFLPDDFEIWDMEEEGYLWTRDDTLPKIYYGEDDSFEDDDEYDDENDLTYAE
jgi:hypothetical protein